VKGTSELAKSAFKNLDITSVLNKKNQEINKVQTISDKEIVNKVLSFIKNKKYTEALLLLNNLEKKNNAWSLNALGHFYERGYGVKQNYNKAYLYYNKAKQLGNITAFYNLAVMYQDGLGREVNFEKALLFYKSAADYNHLFSQTNTGFMYANGLGVAKDLKMALRWYKQAAINGEQTAQRNLGWFYENGYGTSKNYVEAKRWYVLSANQGNKLAIDSLERINTLIKENPITIHNASFSKSLEGFSDIRTITVKSGKKIFETYAAIKQDQIESNWITEGKAISNNELCSASSTYNEKTNARVLLIECPSGYSASGYVTPLGKDRGSRGEGKDSLGNNFQFNLHSKSKGKAKKEDMIAFFEEQKNIIETAALSSTRGFIDKKKLEKSLINSKKFYALIIAINDYKFLPDLKTPLKDGRAIGAILEKKYGFKVDYLENPKRKDITKKLSELSSSLSKNDNLLIYYAGHGKEEEGDGFWLPQDAKEEDYTNWIPNSSLGFQLKKIKAMNILVMSDSCYSGTFLTRGNSNDINKEKRSLDDYLNIKSRVVITSGGEYPVLDDAGIGHSIFAKIMIDYMTNNSQPITAEELYMATRDDIKIFSEKMGHKQIPLYGGLKQHGHKGPDFVFLPR